MIVSCSKLESERVRRTIHNDRMCQVVAEELPGHRQRSGHARHVPRCAATLFGLERTVDLEASQAGIGAKKPLPTDRAVLHKALRDSEEDVRAGRVVDADMVLRELRSR
jgi:hypothetical protein